MKTENNKIQHERTGTVTPSSLTVQDKRVPLSMGIPMMVNSERKPVDSQKEKTMKNEERKMKKNNKVENTTTIQGKGLPMNEPMTDDIIMTKHDGKHIIASNYWNTDQNRRGQPVLLTYRGAFHLLLPNRNVRETAKYRQVHFVGYDNIKDNLAMTFVRLGQRSITRTYIPSSDKAARPTKIRTIHLYAGSVYDLISCPCMHINLNKEAN